MEQPVWAMSAVTLVAVDQAIRECTAMSQLTTVSVDRVTTVAHAKVPGPATTPALVA